LIFNFIDMPRTQGSLTRRGGSSFAHDVPESFAHGATRKRPTTSARRKGQHAILALPDQNPPSCHHDEDVIEHEDVDVA